MCACQSKCTYWMGATAPQRCELFVNYFAVYLTGRSSLERGDNLVSLHPIRIARASTVQNRTRSRLPDRYEQFREIIHADKIRLFCAEEAIHRPCFSINTQVNQDIILAIPVHIAYLKSANADRKGGCQTRPQLQRWQTEEVHA